MLLVANTIFGSQKVVIIDCDSSWYKKAREVKKSPFFVIYMMIEMKYLGIWLLQYTSPVM